MKLYYSPNMNPRVAVAAARHLGAPLEFVRASPRAPGAEADFRPINPNGLVPVLVEPERTLWETDAIVCRLSALMGSRFWRTDDQQPEMIMWISWGAHHLTKAASVFYWWNVIVPTFSDERPSAKVLDDALADFRRYAAILDGRLARRPWLLGEELSYADFRVATALPFAGPAGLPLEDFAQVRRWHGSLLELAAWRDPFAGLSGP